MLSATGQAKQLCYGLQYTGQPALADTPSQELEDLVGKRLTAFMPLLKAINAFILGKRRYNSQMM